MQQQQQQEAVAGSAVAEGAPSTKKSKTSVREAAVYARPGPIRGRRIFLAEKIIGQMWDEVAECIPYHTIWKGYPESEATWEPPEHFVTMELIDEWAQACGSNKAFATSGGEAFLLEEPTDEELLELERTVGKGRA